MKKLILALAILALSISAFTQSVEKEYNFYQPDRTLIGDGDTIVMNWEYVCTDEVKRLSQEYLAFRYRVDQYIDAVLLDPPFFMLDDRLIFQKGMIYNNDDFDYDFDTIINIYHSPEWKTFRKAFLRQGVKEKWTTE